MLVCGIDPGITTGIALYNGETFILANVLEDDHWVSIWEANMVAIETPQIYHGHPRPQDLLTLARTAGELGGMYKSRGEGLVKYVFPREWKRQLDKQMCWRRCLALMTDKEKTSIEHLSKMAESKRHNVQDAIGIALFAAGKRVFN